MNFTSLLPGNRKDPASLLRLYLATGVMSAVIIAFLSGLSFYKIFSGFVIKSAEKDSVQLCHLLLDQQRTKLLKYIPGKGEFLSMDTNDISQFDRTIRMYLHPFNIVKVKIYDLNRTIIYSTELSLIGKTDERNSRLRNALAGNIDVKQVTKEKAHDLAGEPLLDVDVVETYVPIRSAAINASRMNPSNRVESGKVLGSVEIYLNVTEYRNQIMTALTVMTFITAAVLATVFGFSYVLIRRGTLQLKEVQNRLEVLSITDVLTGIGNRGYVMARGEEEFKRAERNVTKGPGISTLCCIMLDIDHFKNVNDTKGHPAGDEVLRELVSRLRQSVRPYDIIGRYGGEEFLVLLPDTVFEEGVAVAERIRVAIHREPFNVCGDDIRISVSLGISSFDDNVQKLDDLLKRADEGLYMAKHAGRDRVEWVYNSLEMCSDSPECC